MVENQQRHHINIIACLPASLEFHYFQEETVPNMEKEISHFQAQGNVLILGDLNSRTGVESDFTDTNGDCYITGNNVTFPSHPHRQSFDLQIFWRLGLCIVNGRLHGD